VSRISDRVATVLNRATTTTVGPGSPAAMAGVGPSAAAVVATPGQVDAVGEVVNRLLAWIVAVDAWTVGLVLELRHPVLTKLMASVTGLGSASAAVVFLGLCYLAGWRRELRTTLASLAVAGVVVVALMALVQRPFPPQPVCVTDGSGMAPHSFPSGHAAAVTVYAAVSRDSDELPFAAVALLAATVAVSRIYLGTHFLSDTLFGVLIGGAAVLASRRVLDRDADDASLFGDAGPF
jgi:undecaprenyl-diphosphatase